ncbi:MAG: nitroreductase/quinone reductase family protein [Anaerolineaceae bacterium]|nr:nitroreductase/quinone reductase family protein [Anaerolineaceae bacterium]
MNQPENIQKALRNDKVIDITTIGRKSGKPRRIEIWFHHWQGNLYLTGLPGPRSWAANLYAHPQFVFHLKESVQLDIPATAVPIRVTQERREILSALLAEMKLPPERSDVDQWVAGSPLFRLVLDESAIDRSND